MRLSHLLPLLLALPLHAQGAPPGLDDFVAKVMKAYQVPGIALTIVKDGKVVLARGYGVRELGKPVPVDSQTTFGIASNSKAFTATAINMLVEEGKLQLDAPVVKYLPAFALSDPYVTSQLTVRDLLVHRSGLGLGAGDLLWWPASTYNRKEIAARLRYIPLATSFRSTYAYDNVLYLVAGEVIEAVSGMSWEDFIQRRILSPLQMTDSRVRHSDASGPGNIAVTHAVVEGVLRPVAPFTSDNTNPAGGINASARDMAKWLLVQLDSGRTGAETRLWSTRTTRELWSIVTPIGSPQGLHPGGYALGFNVTDRFGQKMVTHTGGLPGYVSLVQMFPASRLGLAVLTNQESGAAFNWISNFVVNFYMNVADADYSAVDKAAIAVAAPRVAERPMGAPRDSLSKPSLPLAKYACVYTDPWYGDVSIRLEGGKLVLRMEHTPGMVGDLEHWQYDTFVARWRDRELRADAYVTFALNPDGSVDQVKMRKFLESTDFSFDFQDLLLKRTPANRDCTGAATK